MVGDFQVVVDLWTGEWFIGGPVNGSLVNGSLVD